MAGMSWRFYMGYFLYVTLIMLELQEMKIIN